MLRKIAGVGVLVAIIAFATISGCKKQAGAGAAEATEIPVGEYGSLTGGTASFGTMTHQGLLLAVEQVNANGGLLGKKLKLYTEDDASDASQAVTAVQKLVNSDGVVAVIGEVASKRSLAGGTICQQAHIPMISPSSTNPKVTVNDDGQVRKYIFRICFTDGSQGSVDGKFALNKGWKTVAMLTNTEEDYSKGLAEFFKKAYEAGGGKIAAEETYGSSAVDFQAQLAKIKTMHPDAVYVPGYYTEIGLILPQAKQLGLDVPFFGGDGWDSDKTLALPEAQGMFYSDHFTAEDSRPEVQAFVKAYRARWGTEPDAMAVLGYDAGMVLADAIRRANSADPEAITTALAQTKNFPGASGVITIDDQHNARKTIYMLKIENQKAMLEKAYPPE